MATGPPSFPVDQMESGEFWRDFTDASSGRTYYVNLLTKETTWDKPAGFRDVFTPPPVPESNNGYDVNNETVEADFDEDEPRLHETPAFATMSWEGGQHVDEEDVEWTIAPDFGQNDQAMGINFSNKVRASIRQTRGYSILNTINDGNEESEDYRSLVPIAEMTTGVVYEDTDESETESDFSDDEVPYYDPNMNNYSGEGEYMGEAGAPTFAAPINDMDPVPPNMEAPFNGPEAPSFLPPDIGQKRVAATRDESPEAPNTMMPMPEINFTEEPKRMAPQSVPKRKTTGHTLMKVFSQTNVVSSVIDDYESSDDEDGETAAGSADATQQENKNKKYRSWAKQKYKEFPFMKFATDGFRPEVKGYITSALHKDQIVWSKHLKKSLTPLEDDELQPALEIFKYIKKFMGDRASRKEPYKYIELILNKALGASQPFQDEVYCQLIKQTHQNINPESNLNGWRLIAIIAGIFAPSKSLIKYAAAHMYVNTKDRNIADWANYALERLDDTNRCGRRKFIPTPAELKCCLERIPQTVNIHLLGGDDSLFTVNVTSQTTFADTQNVLYAKLKINRRDFFGIYEYQRVPQGYIQQYFEELSTGPKMTRDEKIQSLLNFPIDRYCDLEERVLDVLSGWEYGPNSDRAGMHLVLKMRLSVQDEFKTLSAEGTRLLFLQCVHNVNYGFYPVPEKIAWRLAAMQVQGIHGVQEEGYYTNNVLMDKLQYYLPYTMYSEERKSPYEIKILTIHGHDYETFGFIDAQRAYIETVQNFESLEQLFGTQVWPVVRITRAVDKTELLLLAIGESGLSLIDPFENRTVEFFPLDKILTWGVRTDVFSFVAGKIERQKKFRLATYCGKEMGSLLKNHVDILSRKLQGDDFLDDDVEDDLSMLKPAAMNW